MGKEIWPISLLIAWSQIGQLLVKLWVSHWVIHLSWYKWKQCSNLTLSVFKSSEQIIHSSCCFTFSLFINRLLFWSVFIILFFWHSILISFILLIEFDYNLGDIIISSGIEILGDVLHLLFKHFLNIFWQIL